jgi:hypothetical protein
VHLHGRGAEGDVIVDPLRIETRGGHEQQQAGKAGTEVTQRLIPVEDDSEW